MIEYSGIKKFQIYLEAAAAAQSEHGRKTVIGCTDRESHETTDIIYLCCA